MTTTALLDLMDETLSEVGDLYTKKEDVQQDTDDRFGMVVCANDHFDNKEGK